MPPLLFNPAGYPDDVHPLCHVLILAAVVLVAWRNRSRHPTAARLFVIAALLCLVHLILRLLEFFHMITFVPQLMRVMGLEDSTGPNASVLAPIAFLAWQGMKCSLRITAWSLIAWAILKQPDDVRRSEPSPC